VASSAPPRATGDVAPSGRRSLPTRRQFLLFVILSLLAVGLVVGLARALFSVPSAPSSLQVEKGLQPGSTAGVVTNDRPAVRAPSATASQKVIDAYLAFWDAYDLASGIPDPLHPKLRMYSTGEYYELVAEQIQAYKLSGRATRLRPGSIARNRPRVVSLDSAKATVRDCEVDDGLIIRVDTGKVVNDEVVTSLLSATLVLEDGRWKVSEAIVEQEWEGVAGCALS
jgi:hypothetical protein